MQKLRIFFKKEGNARFISHLDLMRTMVRAINRAGIKIQYTQGFNPHPYIVFGNPLSLGYQSLREFCDIELAAEMTAEEVRNRLAERMPVGLDVIDVAAPAMEIGDVTYSSYKMVLETASPVPEEAGKVLLEKLTTAPFMIDKKSKSGVKTVELTALIDRIEIERKDGNLFIDVTLPSGNITSANPSLIADAVKLGMPELGEIRMASVTRYEMLNKEKKLFV